MLAEFTDTAYRTPLDQLAHYYGVRTFERGLNWLGLTEPMYLLTERHRPDAQVTASPLLAQLFEVQQGPA